MKHLFKRLTICLLVVLSSCTSSNMKPIELLGKKFTEDYHSHYPELTEWFLKTAELGYNSALLNLGILSKYETEVKQNLANDSYWISKSTEPNNPENSRNWEQLPEATTNSVFTYEPSIKIGLNTMSSIVQHTYTAEQSKEQELPRQESITRTQQNPSNNYTTKSYFATGYVTNGQGGWVNGGMPAGSPSNFSISNQTIKNLKSNETFTYAENVLLFNIPVQVYVCTTNNQFFILRSGNELMFAMTDYGLFLSEIQQVGVANQRLSRHKISGWYNAGSAVTPSSPSQGDTRQQRSSKVCTLCNGTGKYLKEYSSQYGVPGSTPTKYWCDICKNYDYSHYHKTCPSCGGRGVVQ